MHQFKKIVALSFIEAYRNNPLASSKNALAKIISEEINKNENGSILEEHRYAKTLVNYYNFYFTKGKQQKPSITIINKLLHYLGYDSQQHFFTNQPQSEDYLNKVPFVTNVLFNENEIRDLEKVKPTPVKRIKKERKWLKRINVTISISFGALVPLFGIVIEKVVLIF